MPKAGHVSPSRSLRSKATSTVCAATIRSASMVSTAHPKVARFRKKPFPLFYSLEALYEGSVATGQLNFTSTQQLPPAIIPPLAPPAIVPPAPSFVVPSARSTSEQTLHPFNTNPFDLDGQEMTSEAQSVSAIHEAREGEGSKSRKRKQSHVGAALEDYVEFKKSQTNKALDALKELSMRKCMEEIEAIGGFTEEEKSYAVEVFESGINREAFMSTMNHNVQRMWLKRKIRKCVEILM
ncbi:hypothetical protein Zm00014a_010613 [Zea mays]|uniref:Uncharacterized protein n=1 Tax=Zea mays TaxID=4577 RepID=A0A3L6F6Y5_MAIZE|nr:hypothetical protein Zm00014a_010613 [Zea mays]